MDLIKKYKLRTINYNIITKINCNNSKYLIKELMEVQLQLKNKLLNSQYNLIVLLFILQLITGEKPVINKSRKDSLFNGIYKNDCISVKIHLRKKTATSFLLKLVHSYFNIIDVSKLFSFNDTSNVNIDIKNINKIDNLLLKENKLNYNNTLQIILKLFKNTLPSFNISNNITLLLSHLQFPINKYEK